MAIKRLVQMVFVLLVSPRLFIYWLNRFVWGVDRAFLAASESISRIPGMRGVYMRQAFYRITLAGCGSDIYFGWLSTFSMHIARIGERAYIGRRCSVGYADIGSRVMLADGVQILRGGNEHGVAASGDDHQDLPQTLKRVTIGRGAWVGTNAIIMDDVGEGAVVGAGAVVRTPVPPRTVAVGVPAKVVKVLS